MAPGPSLGRVLTDAAHAIRLAQEKGPVAQRVRSPDAQPWQ